MQVTINTDQLVAEAADAIIASDGKGDIILWNLAAERLFGFTQEEALGKPLDMIIPLRQRERHWDGYRKTMDTGQTRYGNSLLRVPALHKDGHTLSIAFTVTLLRAADGALNGVAAIIRDETERWAEERNLRRRVTELEAQIS